jgi:hypothetical protein
MEGPRFSPAELAMASMGISTQGNLYGSGFTPENLQGGSHGQHEWCMRWNNQHHPKLKEMLNVYLDLIHGRLHLADILNAAGKLLTDLPSLPKYMHPNGQTFLCYMKEGEHPDPSNITDKLADFAVDVLSKGVIARVNFVQTGGSAQTKKQKTDVGTFA